MTYDDMMDLKRNEESEGEAGPRPLAFTADEVAQHIHENPDDPDCEVLNLAMERDVAARERYWQQRALDAEERLREYERGYRHAF
jgi:hypothetical protein